MTKSTRKRQGERRRKNSGRMMAHEKYENEATDYVHVNKNRAEANRKQNIDQQQAWQSE